MRQTPKGSEDERIPGSSPASIFKRSDCSKIPPEFQEGKKFNINYRTMFPPVRLAQHKVGSIHLFVTCLPGSVGILPASEWFDQSCSD